MLGLFTAISLLSGIALIALALWLRSRARRCVHWPSVEGVVLESRVDDAHLEMMKPVLRYRYEVNGQSHVGFRVSFSGYGINRDSMQRLIDPYPMGRLVRVHYDPDDPGCAVLDTTAASDWKYWLASGVAFLGLAWFLLP